MKSITYEEILQDYFFNKPLRPATEWSYRKVVNSFIRFTGEQLLPQSVTRQVVLSWRRRVINDQVLSSRTWNNKVAHMRAIFNHAMKYDLIQMKANPFNEVIARPDVKRKKTLTVAQIEKIYLLMEAREKREALGIVETQRNALRPAWFWLTVIDALRYTGMRQNQLLSLRIGDVNLEDNVINLRSDSSKNHKEHQVPVTRALRPRLEQLVNRSLEKGAELSEQLFCIGRFDARKEVLSENMDSPPLRAFFRRLSAECQCTISPHRFRHTIATDMMKSPDRNLKVVQSLLGHSSIAVTLEYVEGNIDSIRMALEENFAARRVSL